MPCQQLSHNVSYGRIVNRIQEKYMNRTLHYYQFSPETQYLDRKSARKKPQELLKHLIAFANALFPSMRRSSFASFQFRLHSDVPIGCVCLEGKD